jgi:hypothetical protein
MKLDKSPKNQTPQMKSIKWNHLLNTISTSLLIFFLPIVGKGSAITLQLPNSKIESDSSLVNGHKIHHKKETSDKNDGNMSTTKSALQKRFELNKTITQKNSEIDSMGICIKKMEKEFSNIPALKRDIAKLQTINDYFKIQFDLLLVENSSLKNEVNALKTEQKKQFTETNGKIERSKQLKAYDISVSAFKRAIWNHKEVITAKANKVNHMLINFTVIENPLVEKGRKEIALKIIDPRGKILANSHDTNSSEVIPVDAKKFSVCTNTNYSDSDVNMVLDFDNKENLTKGNYTIEIYIEGKLCGMKQFSLL